MHGVVTHVLAIIQFDTISKALKDLWDGVVFQWDETTFGPSHFGSLLATKRELDHWQKKGYYYAQLDKGNGGAMVVNVYRKDACKWLGMLSGIEYYVIPEDETKGEKQKKITYSPPKCGK